MIPTEDYIASLAGFSSVLSLFSAIPGMLVGLAVYLANAYGIYTLAARRGLQRPWLAWVPVVNAWVLGAIADDYRRRICDELKSRRKILLGTSIAVNILGIVFSVFFIILFVQLIVHGEAPIESPAALAGTGLAFLVCALAMLAVFIVHAVFYYIALYDLYKSCEPRNASAYLVISILISYSQPVFLFVCRNKDEGMKLAQPRPAPAEPWQQSEE